uniref:Uncharacterized protein n=1 Tax=Romanomermis culicivorax TaxID=13658 RepID=A0A915I8Q8_ROMCU
MPAGSTFLAFRPGFSSTTFFLSKCKTEILGVIGVVGVKFSSPFSIFKLFCCCVNKDFLALRFFIKGMLIEDDDWSKFALQKSKSTAIICSLFTVGKIGQPKNLHLQIKKRNLRMCLQDEGATGLVGRNLDDEKELEAEETKGYLVLRLRDE